METFILKDISLSGWAFGDSNDVLDILAGDNWILNDFFAIWKEVSYLNNIRIVCFWEHDWYLVTSLFVFLILCIVFLKIYLFLGLFISGAQLSGAQFATFGGRTVGPRTTGPLDSWAPDNRAPGQIKYFSPGPEAVDLATFLLLLFFTLDWKTCGKSLISSCEELLVLRVNDLLLFMIRLADLQRKLDNLQGYFWQDTQRSNNNIKLLNVL